MKISQIPIKLVSGKAWVMVLVIVAFALGLLARGGAGDRPQDATHQEADHQETDHQEETTWICSMHPQIQLPKAGQCPICFMDLIPVDDGQDEELGPRSLVLSEAAAALAEIQTVPVQRRSATAEVRLLGKVAYDETRYRTLSAWVAGRIDTVFVDFTGAVVREGEPLVSLYSPELYATQAELINALKAVRELQASDIQIIRQTAEATVSSARERLRLWGLNSEQITGIERRGSPSHHLAIRSPLSGIVVHKNAVEGMYVQTGSRIYTVADLSRVWVTFAAYESDLAWLQEGQTIDFAVEALPGRAFSGSIVFIDPILDEKTRTVKVRLDVDNSHGVLKPGMFVHAVVSAALSVNGQSSTGESMAEEPLVIPASAPLITGKRAVVYVRLPDRQQPTFEGREVVLGPRAGDFYLVESGLGEGELVVAKGNFKIDSALQIQAKPSMMNPTGDGPAPGHQHGPPAKPSANPAGETTLTHFDAPAAFIAQLDDLLTAYLEIQTALAGDDDMAAVQAADLFATALRSVDMGLLSGDAHMAWMKDLDRLKKALSSHKAADDIAARREAFQPLSDTMWDALRRFDYQGNQDVRLFFCPMAKEGAGADWLQTSKTTANPFYGASMLRCGNQTDAIAAMALSEGGH